MEEILKSQGLSKETFLQLIQGEVDKILLAIAELTSLEWKFFASYRRFCNGLPIRLWCQQADVNAGTSSVGV